MSTTAQDFYNPDNKNFSYADVHGTWEERKINIIGPLKSLISQLRVGQDMTKVSLPSVLLRPYSMVEEFGSRTLGHIPILYESSTQTKPLERMLTVVSWVLSTTRDENFNHKPFNAILGETHVARMTESDTYTYFFGEQISHHPPVTAFVVQNTEHQISITGTYSFSIKFAPNTIFVTTEGKCEIHLGDEVYIMDKSLPDMVIKNSLIGKKAVAWVGKISVRCPKTGWHAELDYHISKDLIKYVEGTIICLERTDEAQCLYIGGKCGGTIYKSLSEIKNVDKLQDESEVKEGSYLSLFRSFMPLASSETKPVKKPTKHKSSKSLGHVSESVEELLVDFTGKKELVPQYPSLDKLPENSSRVVWKDAALHIVCNQMEKADEAKLVVEEAQRIKSREGSEPWTPAYFYQTEGGIWRAKEESVCELASLFE